MRVDMLEMMEKKFEDEYNKKKVGLRFGTTKWELVKRKNIKMVQNRSTVPVPDTKPLDEESKNKDDMSLEQILLSTGAQSQVSA